MMERVKGLIVFQCDECDETLETEEEDFDEARIKARKEGWTFFRSQESGEWVHICEDCT